ncbi:MAG: MmcQ/YjbR family DNA-binding protein [Gemmatimonadota bacterium]
MSGPDRERSARELKLIEKVKKITAKLPGIDVGIDGFGHTTFKAGKKSLVLIGGGEGQGSLSVKADVETQRALVKRGPWLRTPFIGQHGWITAWGDAKLDWDEVAELVSDAYRASAPKRLLEQLDQ